MLIVPASNAVDPVTVVIRSLSNAPERLGLIPPPFAQAAAAKPIEWLDTQLFEFILVITACPYRIFIAEFITTINPNVEVNPPVVAPLDAAVEDDVYPEVLKEPEPICTKILSVAARDTPLNITVIRFAQLGMSVKLTLVPDVEATAVPEVNGCVNPTGGTVFSGI